MRLGGVVCDRRNRHGHLREAFDMWRSSRKRELNRREHHEAKTNPLHKPFSLGEYLDSIATPYIQLARNPAVDPHVAKADCLRNRTWRSIVIMWGQSTG